MKPRDQSQKTPPGAPVPVYRFAPSPNGLLHLGHAYSALLNLQLARANGGRMLLRIEDIDRARCTPHHERLMLEDLEWIGFEWDEPPLRQSARLPVHAEALEAMLLEGLVYPSVMSRRDIRERIEALSARGSANWPTDPDGAPVYPGEERELAQPQREAILASGVDHALRLDMAAAIRRVGHQLWWQEEGEGPNGENGRILADPARWGDVILGRKDTPASYHLACVIDDAWQGVTHVVRGRDLFHATSVHVLLQVLFVLPGPRYLHHDLILGADGRKLSKSRGDIALRHLREAGATPGDIRRMIGLPGEGPG